MIDAIASNPLFGLFITIIFYEFAVWLYKKVKTVLLTPFLVTTLLVIAFLLIFDIDYDAYNVGGQMITTLIGPLTIILAVPLYKQAHILKKNGFIIVIGIIAGCVASLLSMAFFAYVFDFDTVLFASLIPKSVTTAISVEISASLGGSTVIATLAVMVAGLTGAVFAPVLSKILGIKNEVAVGLAIGTSAHVLGTSKAVELGETQAAMSSLAIGIAGVITVIIAPIISRFFI